MIERGINPFGSCPDCMTEASTDDAVRIVEKILAGTDDANAGAWPYLNIGKEHWFYCDAHRVRWCIGRNIFSSWMWQTEDEQRAEYEGKDFGRYREVEPL